MGLLLTFDIEDNILLSDEFSSKNCLKIRVIKLKFCCNSMISQPPPNSRTQFSQKEKVGSYDKIALNQPFRKSVLTTNFSNEIQTKGEK